MLNLCFLLCLDSHWHGSTMITAYINISCLYLTFVSNKFDSDVWERENNLIVSIFVSNEISFNAHDKQKKICWFKLRISPKKRYLFDNQSIEQQINTANLLFISLFCQFNPLKWLQISFFLKKNVCVILILRIVVVFI